jgi:hypothetical protein
MKDHRRLISSNVTWAFLKAKTKISDDLKLQCLSEAAWPTGIQSFEYLQSHNIA